VVSFFRKQDLSDFSFLRKSEVYFYRKKYTSDFFEKSDKSFFRKKYISDFRGKSEESFFGPFK